MAIRIRTRMELAISSSPTEERDLGNLSVEVVTDALNEGGIRKMILAPGATDTVLPVPDLSQGKFLMIRTNAKDATLPPATVAIRRNFIGAEELPIVPLDGRIGLLMISTEGLIGLFGSNKGTTEMELIIAVAGD